MKNTFLKITAGALALAMLAGCGGTGGSAQDDNASSVITVGASPTPHAEILNAAKDAMAAKGYELQVQEFTDYVQPNIALSDGSLDANYFQHITYLENFNQNNGTDLANAGAIHYEPFGIYPGKAAALEDLQDGDEIVVPTDDTNETRALLLLEAQGLIKLREGIDPTISATVIDIAENPKNLVIREIEAAQLARSLQDVALGVINGNYAIQAGLSVENDAIAIEDKGSDSVQTYANVIAVRSGDENKESIKALIEVLTSDEIRDYINENYDGAVVPIF